METAAAQKRDASEMENDSLEKFDDTMNGREEKRGKFDDSSIENCASNDEPDQVKLRSLEILEEDETIKERKKTKQSKAAKVINISTNKKETAGSEMEETMEVVKTGVKDKKKTAKTNEDEKIGKEKEQVREEEELEREGAEQENVAAQEEEEDLDIEEEEEIIENELENEEEYTEHKEENIEVEDEEVEEETLLDEDIENEDCIEVEATENEDEVNSSKVAAPVVINEEKLYLVPFILSLHLAKKKLPCEEGENFLLPAITVTIETLFGSEAAASFAQTSLTTNVFRTCLTELASHARKQTINALKSSESFGLLLDESTDSAFVTHLLVYARFLENNEFKEEFLFAKSLPADPSAREVYSAISSFFHTHQLSWTSCVDVCIDNTAILTGADKDVVGLMLNANRHMTTSRCLIHRQKMASKDILSLLSTALIIGIRIINLIKTRPLDPNFRKALWKDFQGEYTPILLNSDKRWLSHGKCLGHLVEHRVEVLRILNEMKNTNLASYVQDGVWLLSISYLADLIEKINDLSLTLKSSKSNVLMMHDKINALIKKLDIWTERVVSGSTEMFPLLTKCIKGYLKEWSNVAKKLVCGHLPQVAAYFLSFRQKHHYDWIRNPFLADSESQMDLSIPEKDELLELSSDRSLKLQFQHELLEVFWLKQKNEYPLLYKKALKTFLQFKSTALCDLGFSTFADLSSKFNGDKCIENYMILGLTQRNPGILNVDSTDN